MKSSKAHKLMLAAAVVAFAGFATSAQADFIGSFVSIQVSNGNSSARFDSLLPPQAADQASWSLTNALELRGGPNGDGELIATIDNLSVSLDGDPVVSLNFAVTAGNSPTNFQINSAVVAFPALNNPLAKATAAMTLTDNNLNGASASVIAPNVNGMWRAVYNGGSVFTEEIGNLSIGGGSTSADNGNPPFTNIAGSVNSIQSNFSFNLSSLDSASGTSNFTVLIPEPASLALLGLGTLTMFRRR